MYFVINYVVVATFYGIGCFCAYTLGYRHGFNRAVTHTINLFAKHFGWTTDQVAAVFLKISKSVKKREQEQQKEKENRWNGTI